MNHKNKSHHRGGGSCSYNSVMRWNLVVEAFIGEEQTTRPIKQLVDHTNNVGTGGIGCTNGRTNKAIGQSIELNVVEGIAFTQVARRYVAGHRTIGAGEVTGHGCSGSAYILYVETGVEA